jgi:SAM-dependent methyltransferase
MSSHPSERRFRSAAAHYVTGRPPYPSALIDRVAEACGVGHEDRVLDLGCGPGPLALAFAGHAGEVVAVDPEPNMLDLARAAAAGVGNIHFIAASSDDLGPALGRFRLVTIGRAFHWMDRVRVLGALDALVVPGGAVALFSTSPPRIPHNRWQADYEALLDRFAPIGQEVPFWKAPDWIAHDAILLDSPFCRLERFGALERRHITPEILVDRALSRSGTSPHKLGDRAAEFAQAVSALGHEFCNSDGFLTEVVEGIALVAWREN